MLHQQEYLLKPFEEAGIMEQYQTLTAQQRQIDACVVDLIAQYADSQSWDGDSEQFRGLVEKRRKFPQCIYSDHLQFPHRLESYSDSIARYVLEKVTVLDAEHLLVTFKGGAMVEQAL